MCLPGDNDGDKHERAKADDCIIISLAQLSPLHHSPREFALTKKATKSSPLNYPTIYMKTYIWSSLEEISQSPFARHGPAKQDAGKL
jgi:hypothetical protein